MKKLIISNKREIITFIIIFIITLIIFIPFLQKHYATDSYNTLSMGYKEYAINYSLNDGRVFMALIGYIADLLKMPFDIYIIILTIMALFVSCISVISLKKYILEIKKSKNLFSEIFVIIISYFTVFNFMYIENMHFIECFVMSLSILLYIFAAKKIVEKDNHYLIKASVFLILGIFCYQGTISMYLVSLFLFSLLKDRKYNECIKNLIKGVLILVCGIILQFIIISCSGKIFNIQQERLSGFYGILTNIIYSIYYLKDILINTGYVYTKYLFLFFLSMIELLIFLKVYKEKLGVEVLINIFFITLLSIFSGISVSFISLTGFYSARIRFSIGAMIGFLIIYLYCKTDIADKYKKINLLIISVFVIYAVSIVTNYISIMNNVLKVNLQDKCQAIEISNYIENYEKDNGISVNKLVVFPGKLNEEGYYENLKYRGSAMSWCAIKTYWSIKGIIEMYSNKHFIMVEPDENKLKYYLSNENKDYMCIEDTLYVAYYVN